jgi:large repetitive protein
MAVGAGSSVGPRVRVRLMLAVVIAAIALAVAPAVAAAAPPSVTGVSPSAGPTGGGNTVTITGTEFVPGAAVSFGTSPGIAPVLISATELRVTAPAHAAGVVRVTVTTPAGSARAPTTQNYTFGAPVVTNLSPGAGGTGGGETVTITGRRFTFGATVQFGSTPASNVVWLSPSQLRVTAPPGAEGTVDVTVTTPAATSAVSAASKYRYDRFLSGPAS